MSLTSRIPRSALPPAARRAWRRLPSAAPTGARPRPPVNLTRPLSTTAAAAPRESSVVGFVGLGNMGLPMCLNVLRHQDPDHGDGPHATVVAFDTDADAVSRAVDAGATPAESSHDVGAAGCDVVFTVLPDDSIVRSVFDQLLEGAAANLERGGDGSNRSTVFADCSTVSPSTSRSVADSVLAAGYAHMDAPVSGGVKGAADGTLTFMVGSDLTSLERAAPYLNRMGKAVIHCGGSGTGSSTKLCNNLALAAQMAGICEAMNLGEALGVDPIVLADVMNASTAKCWSSEVDNPHPQVATVRGRTAAANDYEGGFAARLMLKDVGLAVGAAQEEGVAVPIGSATKELYRMIERRGLGGKDFGVLLQFLRGK